MGDQNRPIFNVRHSGIHSSTPAQRVPQAARPQSTAVRRDQSLQASAEDIIRYRRSRGVTPFMLDASFNDPT